LNKLVSKYVEQYLSRLEPTQLAAGVTQELRKSAYAFAKDECTEATIFERGTVLEYILDEVKGFGPIEILLRDSKVVEVHVYSSERILRREAHTRKLTTASCRFLNTNQYDRVVQRLIKAKDERGNITRVDGTRINIEFTPEQAKEPHIKIIRGT
jgi:Flp pilus assembly CpaF family ATPase